MATVKDTGASFEVSATLNQSNCSDIYHFLFANHPSKMLTMIAGFIIIAVDVVLFLGIIWFERFEYHHSRTLMNKIFSRLCWTCIFGLGITFCDIIRYSTGPFGPNLCYILFNLKIMFKSMILMFVNALIIAR